MGKNDDNEELFDVSRNLRVGRNVKLAASSLKENSRVTIKGRHNIDEISKRIKGRPNIDEISKRNEEEEKLERRSSYKTTGIIILTIIVVMLLVYFFS